MVNCVNYLLKYLIPSLKWTPVAIVMPGTDTENVIAKKSYIFSLWLLLFSLSTVATSFSVILDH